MNKGVVVAAGVVVVGGTLAILLSRKAGEDGAVSLKITLYDAAGKPVSDTVNAGQSYKVRVTLTNRSEAVLDELTLSIAADGLIPIQDVPLSLAGKQTRDFYFDMAVPDDATGSAAIIVGLYDRDAEVVADMVKKITVSALPPAEFYMPPELQVSSVGPVNGMYTVTFTTQIKNNGGTKGKYRLTWGSNELGMGYVEEYGRGIELEPGETYDWSWSWTEIPDWYRGLFTVWLFGDWEKDNAAMRVWT